MADHFVLELRGHGRVGLEERVRRDLVPHPVDFLVDERIALEGDERVGKGQVRDSVVDAVQDGGGTRKLGKGRKRVVGRGHERDHALAGVLALSDHEIAEESGVRLSVAEGKAGCARPVAHDVDDLDGFRGKQVACLQVERGPPAVGHLEPELAVAPEGEVHAVAIVELIGACDDGRDGALGRGLREGLPQAVQLLQALSVVIHVLPLAPSARSRVRAAGNHAVR